MTPDNISPDQGQVLEVSLREQMEIYDSLPKALRDLYDAIPEPEDLRNFRALVDLHGAVAAREMIVREIERLYPTWKGPEG